MRHFLLIVVLCFVSCTKTVKTNTETHDKLHVAKTHTDTLISYQSARDTVYLSHTDTVYKTDVRHDSIVTKDSVFVRERNDSVYVYKERWNTKIVAVRDTIYRSRTDTVYRNLIDTVTVYKTINNTDTINHLRDYTKSEVKEKKRIDIWFISIFSIVVVVSIVFSLKRSN